MVITKIENPNKNLLERLKEDNIEVRINYLGEKSSYYLGKIKEVTKQDISLLPYVVWENVPTPNIEKFLNRCRIETKYPKLLPLMGALPEPLSKGYIEEIVKLQNYFNSLMIIDKRLRNKVFNKKIYLMPSEEEIKSIEKSLLKK
ncbi:MAG: hypothetical protein V1663_02475 [archaeon]